MAKVFVYGTLLKGLERHQALKNSHFLGPALLSGACLYDLGAYPGAVLGAGEIAGELYEVSAETLAALDVIEQYQPSAQEDSLYLRQKLPVRLFANGETVAADTYLYNGDISQAPLIEFADYRRYRLKMTDSNVWMLAFGSNLSTERLEARVGSCPVYQVAWLSGYELVFNKSSHDANVYANIRYTGNARCPGVAYQLTFEQIMALDPYEKGYVRMVVPAETEASESLLVQLYLAHPDEMCPETLPQPEYKHHIVTGCREHNLSLVSLHKALQRAA